MPTPRERYLKHLADRGEKPVPTVEQVADPIPKLSGKAKCYIAAGFVLPVLMMGAFLISQLPWHQLNNWYQSAGSGYGYVYQPGPTLNVALPSNMSAAVDAGDMDWDVLPALEIANGPNGTWMNQEFMEGNVSASTATPGKPVASNGGYTIEMPYHSGLPAPTVNDGVMYVSAGFSGYDFAAINVSTGKTLWNQTLSDNGPSSAVTQDGMVVVNTESCTIFALDAETGQHRWSWYLGDPQTSAPAVHGGRVFASYPAGGGNTVALQDANGKQTGIKMAMSHVLACFDLQSGNLLWQNWINGDVITHPVPTDDGQVWVATHGGSLLGFDSHDGRPVFARLNRITTAPVLHGKQIAFARRTDEHNQPISEAIVLVDVASGQETARFIEREAPYLDAATQAASMFGAAGAQLDAGNGLASGSTGIAEAHIGLGNVSTLLSYHGSRPLILGQTILATMGDTVYAWNLSDQQQLWNKPLPGDLKQIGGSLGTPPVNAHGQALVGQIDGKLKAFDPATGEVLSTWETDLQIRTPPVVNDEWIVATGELGNLAVMPTRRPATGLPLHPTSSNDKSSRQVDQGAPSGV